MRTWLAFLLLSMVGSVLAVAQERQITQLARDGTGRLWSIGQTPGESVDLAWQEGDSWPSQTSEALEEATPQVLLTLRDGSVACLWSLDDRQEAVLTRQRGDAAPRLTKIAAQLHAGRMIERDDGSLLITENGPNVVEISAKDEARITAIPEAFFELPADAGEPADREYVPIRALEDERHHVWLWAYALDPAATLCQLKNFVRYEDGAVRLHEVPDLEPAARISDMLSADADHLWFAKVGVGIFALGLEDNQTELKSKPLPVRNGSDNVQYIEQLFRVGADCFAVTSPKPTSNAAQVPEVSIQGGVVLNLRFNFWLGGSTGRLLRYHDGAFVELIGGMDRRPRFGWWDRPHLMTGAGLLISSHENGPWLVLRPEKKVGLRVDWRSNFPLKDTVQLLAEDESHFRAVASTGGMAVFPLEPPTDLPPARCREFTLQLPFLQDARGQLWGFRANQLIRGNGEKGHPMPAPEAVKPTINGTKWLGDDRDQGWLRSPAGTSICKFSTGGWSSYASWDEALVAQLPEGAKIRIPRNPFLSPVYSREGQIAYLSLGDGLHFYDGRVWRKWTPKEIAGEQSEVAGAPFFDAAHRLGVPLGEHDWIWDPAEARWLRQNRDQARVLGTLKNDVEPPVPEGCPIEKPSSIGIDPAGTTWLTSAEGKLYKVAGSRTVPVLAENEPNPFRYGTKFSNLLVDSEGGVIFELESNSDTLHAVHYVYLAPKFPQPKATLEITDSRDDRARVRFTTDADPKAEIWFSWQLDDGPWQPLQHRPEYLISNLAKGPHRFQLRAYNAELGTSRLPAVLEWTMPLPEKPVPPAGEHKAPAAP